MSSLGDICTASRGALAVASSWHDAFVVLDAGAAQAMASLGGVAWLLDELNVASVAQLDLDGNVELNVRKLCALERSRRGLPEGEKDSSQAVRLIFVVTQLLPNLEKSLAMYLKGSFSSTWIVATILSNLPAKAHNIGQNREGIDFTSFAMRLQSSARPNAAEVQVTYVPWAVDLLVDTMPLSNSYGSDNDKDEIRWASFALASKAAHRVFPVTLCRHGLWGQRSNLTEVDGNADLSEEFKSDLRSIARELLGVLTSTLDLDFTKNCWAAGFTSRVIGNAMLSYLKEEGASPKTTSVGSRPATLIIIDRTLDLTNAISQSLAPLICDDADGVMTAERNFVERKVGLLSTRQAWDAQANELLRHLNVSSTEDSSRALRSYVGKIDHGDSLSCALARRNMDASKLPSDHVLIMSALALEKRTLPENQGLIATERIILESHMGATHKLLPLVDLCNRHSYTKEEIQRLALLAYNLLSRMPPSGDEEDAEAVFADSLQSAGINKHILKALREVRQTDACRDVVLGESLLCAILDRGIQHLNAPSALTRLGESAFEKTAKEIENHARNLFKQSFNVFGFGGRSTNTGGSGGASSTAHQTEEQHRLKISSQDICVIFFVGGISHQDIREAVQLLERSAVRPKLILFTGTSLINGATVTQEMYKVVQVPSFTG